MESQPGVLVISTDPQGSATWWASRIPNEKMPFDFTRADRDPTVITSVLRKLRAEGAQVHVIASQKGGVGKTTTTMNLAAMTAEAVPTGVDGYRHVFVDTPGYIETQGADNSMMQKILEAALDDADDVLVPLPPEGLAFDATARTVKMLKDRGKPFRIVINNWDPRDGEVDLEQTMEYVTAQGWPHTVRVTPEWGQDPKPGSRREISGVIRRYKVHTRASVQGELVTHYARNRTTLEAQRDYYRVAMQLGYGGKI